jgi:hypothetical protein
VGDFNAEDTHKGDKQDSVCTSIQRLLINI